MGKKPKPIKTFDEMYPSQGMSAIPGSGGCEWWSISGAPTIRMAFDINGTLPNFDRFQYPPIIYELDTWCSPIKASGFCVGMNEIEGWIVYEFRVISLSQ